MNIPRIYVIESRWDWNISHTEYATLSLEDHDFNGKPIKDLEDPSCSAEDRRSFFRRLKEIAKLQSGDYKGALVLVAVYRVALIEEKEGSGMKKVSFYLKPVFRFDQDGKPVPVP